jgi:hypothetical protein
MGIDLECALRLLTLAWTPENKTSDGHTSGEWRAALASAFWRIASLQSKAPYLYRRRPRRLVVGLGGPLYRRPWRPNGRLPRTGRLREQRSPLASVLAFATALEQAQQPNASIYFAPTQIMRPSTPLLDPTIAVTPANTPAAAYLPTKLPPQAAARSRPAPGGLLKGTTLLTYRGHKEWVRAVAWSPDGTKIASGSHDKTIHIWDTQTGNLLHVYQGHSWMVTGVAWSPDGSSHRFIRQHQQSHPVGTIQREDPRLSRPTERGHCKR